jgi:hypothetical protein
MNRSARRIASSLALALGLAGSAFAQSRAAPSALPPSFALLSLVGDQFTVVTRGEESASRLDSNLRRSYPIDVSALDDAALDAAESVLKRVRPVSPVARFSIRDARLFALQDKVLDDSGGLREALAKLLREQQATRLVLVTKLREEARFRIVNGTIGSGKISGLGFYVDPFTRMEQTSTGEATFGFLGPYAYVNVTIVDVETMKPLRSVGARESEMSLPVHSQRALGAWDALTPEAKVDALVRVLRSAVERATTQALAE